MYELALFSGAGGGILGGILNGHRCVGAVEIERYPRLVLQARQKDGILPWFPIWDDISTFRLDNPACKEYIEWLISIRDKLVISGGFPCQDISAANIHAVGIGGSRSSLWREMARVIREVRPRYALVENSPLLISRGLGEVLGDLAEMGCNARWGVFSVASLGGPILRRRIFILAEPQRLGIQGYSQSRNALQVSDAGRIWGVGENRQNDCKLSAKLHSSQETVGLNPCFAEKIMAWPIGVTDLKPLGTDKFQQWLNSHGIASPNIN